MIAQYVQQKSRLGNSGFFFDNLYFSTSLQHETETKLILDKIVNSKLNKCRRVIDYLPFRSHMWARVSLQARR